MAQTPTAERRLRWLPTMLVGLGALVVYVWTASRHLDGGDSILFTTISVAGGHAHPPGYPLYSLYLQAAGWLPAASPTHAASLGTALLGAGAVAAVYAAARAWGGSIVSALFAAATFGTANTVWLYHTQPEVFALNHLLAGALLFGSAPNSPVGGIRRTTLLGLLAGLGLSNHHSIVLLAPVGLYGVWTGVRESDRPATAFGSAVGAGLVGLSPYVYPIFAADEPRLPWGHVANLRDLFELFFRERYGTLTQTPGGRAGTPLYQVGLLGIESTRDLRYAAPILSVFWGASRGLDLLKNRGDRDGGRGDVWLVASLVTAGPLFASLFNLAPLAHRFLTVRRMHLLFELLVAVTAALGLERLLRAVELGRAERLFPVLALVAGLTMGNSHLDSHRGPAVEAYLEDTFGRLPAQAVVLGAEDVNGFGMYYYRRALNRRPDVDYVQVSSLEPGEWYARHAASFLGVEIPFDGDGVDRSALIERLLETDRPVFVSTAFEADQLSAWPTVPRGTLVEIRPEDEEAPSAPELFELNRRFLRNSPFPRTGTPPEHSWHYGVALHYAEILDRVAERLEDDGHSEAADRVRRLRDRFVADYGER